MIVVGFRSGADFMSFHSGRHVALVLVHVLAAPTIANDTTSAASDTRESWVPEQPPPPLALDFIE